jgi:hypothetical protein
MCEDKMNKDRRTAKVVQLMTGKVACPKPFEADYGPLSDAMLAEIDRCTDQDDLAGGEVLKRFN